jgi:nucleotide-binding universal stress UspA family protein
MTAQRNDRTGPVIVVGVDGSPAGDAALKWAVTEATQRHGTVRAVSVRQPPQLMPAASYALEPHGTRQPERDDIEWARWLRDRIDNARTGVDDPAHVTAIMLLGDPAAELHRVAEDADLLVVGGHGQGPLAEVFLGSVAAASVRHAPCPIVVIPTLLATATTE